MVILANGKTSYCVRASIRVTENVLYTTNFLLHTGAQSRSVAKGFLPDLWIKEIRDGEDLNLCSTIKDPIIVLGKIDLFITPGDQRTKSAFSVVEMLLMKTSIEACFIVKYVTGINPTERKLTPLDL